MDEKKLKCFVIRPIQDRSDLVMDLYVHPACADDYEVIPAGDEASAAPITEDIFRHLSSDDLVVAYLGSPARMEGQGNLWFWNPNVMLEAGYRMGLKRPIVFIRERRQSENEPFLPFDLANLEAVELPSEADERGKREHRDRAISKIRDLVEAHARAQRAAAEAERKEKENSRSPDQFPAPAVTMTFDTDVPRIESASEDAATFFGFPTSQCLIGMKVSDLREKIVFRMSPVQSQAFQEEQERLIGQIFSGVRPLASVCLVFNDQLNDQSNDQPKPQFDNAYLPVVARFAFRKNGPTTLSVIYLEVTDTAKLESDGVVRCRLSKPKAKTVKK